MTKPGSHAFLKFRLTKSRYLKRMQEKDDMLCSKEMPVSKINLLLIFVVFFPIDIVPWKRQDFNKKLFQLNKFIKAQKNLFLGFLTSENLTLHSQRFMF